MGTSLRRLQLRFVGLFEPLFFPRHWLVNPSLFFRFAFIKIGESIREREGIEESLNGVFVWCERERDTYGFGEY